MYPNLYYYEKIPNRARYAGRWSIQGIKSRGTGKNQVRMLFADGLYDRGIREPG